MQEIEKLSICELVRNCRYFMVIVNQAKYYEFFSLEGVLSINPMNLIKSYCSQFKERFNRTIFQLLAELSDSGI